MEKIKQLETIFAQANADKEKLETANLQLLEKGRTSKMIYVTSIFNFM